MDNQHPLPRLLTIDDDPGLRALIRATLGESYEVLQTIDGQAGLAVATRQPPDLILLDITMPGLSGYEVCRALRANEATRAVPVIFLSALSRLEDRLAAYDAGGDDFLGKPFDAEELTDKIELALLRVAERQRLEQEKASAFATAMTALSASSEIGVVLAFLRQSFTCNSHVALAEALIEAAATWGLTACVQLRGGGGDVSRNRAGPSSPLESGVLGTLAGCGRVAAFGCRLAINYPHVTLMIVDMPIDDAERNGRLRDDLAWLAEAAEARVLALDNELARGAQQQTLQRLVQRTGSALAEIESRRRVQKAEAVVHMQDLLTGMTRAFSSLELNDAEEEYLTETLRLGIDRVIEIFEQGLATDVYMQAIAGELADAAGYRLAAGD